jgi:hypothetical protein
VPLVSERTGGEKILHLMESQVHNQVKQIIFTWDLQDEDAYFRGFFKDLLFALLYKDKTVHRAQWRTT